AGTITSAATNASAGERGPVEMRIIAPRFYTGRRCVTRSEEDSPELERDIPRRAGQDLHQRGGSRALVVHLVEHVADLQIDRVLTEQVIHGEVRDGVGRQPQGPGIRRGRQHAEAL